MQIFFPFLFILSCFFESFVPISGTTNWHCGGVFFFKGTPKNLNFYPWLEDIEKRERHGEREKEEGKERER